jgi:hypothetical protein
MYVGWYIVTDSSFSTFQIQIPQWEQGSQFPAGNGGAVAVVYYKDTDTYSLCRYLAAAQQDGYAGMCR